MKLKFVKRRFKQKRFMLLGILIIIFSIFVWNEELSLKGNNAHTKLNVVEKMNLSLNLNVDQKEISSYRNFIQNNKQYKKQISMIELQNQLELATSNAALNQYKTSNNLSKTIIKELNIGFLLDDLDNRRLVVTTTAVNQYEEYTEKELLFKDSQVGTFSVLFLVPNNKSGYYPAIIGLHGHGDSSKVFRDNYLGKELAKAGFVVIMPSFRAMECESENIISIELLMNGFTLMGLRVYETLLVMKYLKYKDFVNTDKIGIIGHSGGSHTAYLTSIISSDVKAGVYGRHSLTVQINFCGDLGIHCETIPSLSYYRNQINDAKSTLNIPWRQFRYGYQQKNNKQKVIDFFMEILYGV